LITRAERLADFPEIGRMVPEFRQLNPREIIRRSYPPSTRPLPCHYSVTIFTDSYADSNKKAWEKFPKPL